MQHNLTDIININLKEGKVPRPLILSGEAGMGKTITTHQIALNYVNELEHMVELHEPLNISNLNLPFFFKAKKMIFDESDDILIDENNPSVRAGYAIINGFKMPYHLNLLHFQIWSIYQSGRVSINYDVVRIIDLHNGNVTYFIDGLDELPNRKIRRSNC